MIPTTFGWDGRTAKTSDEPEKSTASVRFRTSQVQFGVSLGAGAVSLTRSIEESRRAALIPEIRVD
jgi:hypothetical protein